MGVYYLYNYVCVYFTVCGSQMKIRYCTRQREAERALRPLRNLYLLKKPMRVGIDIETFNPQGDNAGDPFTSNIRSLQVNWGGEYITFLDFLYLDVKKFPWLKKLLRDKRVLKIAHNAKFEWKFICHRWGVRMKNVWCTMNAQKVLDNGKKDWGFGLADLEEEYFGEKLDKTIRDTDWGKPVLDKKQIKYGARDVKNLLDIQKIQEELADERSFGVINLENEVLPAFADMELNGILIDQTKIEKVKNKYEKKLLKLLNKIQNKLPWVDIPKSKLTKAVRASYPDGVKPVGVAVTPKDALCIQGKYIVKDAKNDIKKALKTLGIALPKAYDSGEQKYKESLSIDNVDTLEWKYAWLLKEYFKHVSLYNKYLSKMNTWTNRVTGRVHADIKQMVVTGRCAFADPPLQQMPKEKWFRSMFIAKSGYSLLKLDYSQLELRLTAETSRDPVLLSEYAKGLDADLHTQTAIKVFADGIKRNWDKLPDEKKKKYRNECKPVNFGTIYGQGARGLQQYLQAYGIYWSIEQCRAAINAWFDLYKGVRRYHSGIYNAYREGFKLRKTHGEWEVVSRFGKDGFFRLYTLGGRQRFWMHSDVLKSRAVGVARNKKTNDPYIYARVNEHYNHPIQGSAADGMKMAMVRIYKWLRKTKIDVKILLQIHDELVLEVPVGMEAQVARVVRRIMEEEMQKLVKLVPIYVDAAYGPNWAAENEIPRDSDERKAA